MISVKIQKGSKGGRGLGALIDHDLPKKASESFAKSAGAIAQQELERAINSKAQRPTGALANSFRASITGGRGLAGVAISSTKKYARIQDSGGVITARNVKYLHFRAYSGQWVRIKRVRIPGLRYLAEAARRLRPLLSKLLSDALAAQVRSQR